MMSESDSDSGGVHGTLTAGIPVFLASEVLARAAKAATLEIATIVLGDFK
jgi:hypothetical protein